MRRNEQSTSLVDGKNALVAGQELVAVDGINLKVESTSRNTSRHDIVESEGRRSRVDWATLLGTLHVLANVNLLLQNDRVVEFGVDLDLGALSDGLSQGNFSLHLDGLAASESGRINNELLDLESLILIGFASLQLRVAQDALDGRGVADTQRLSG